MGSLKKKKKSEYLNLFLETMGEEAADDQTPFLQTQPAEHPLQRTGLASSVHPFHY